MALSDFCNEKFNEMVDEFYECFDKYETKDMSVYFDAMISLNTFDVMQAMPPGHEIPNPELHGARATIQNVLEACKPEFADEIADYIAEVAKINSRLKAGIDDFVRETNDKKHFFKTVDDPTAKMRYQRMQKIAGE